MITQEIKKLLNGEKIKPMRPKIKTAGFEFYAVSGIIYFLLPPMTLGLAYRIYWRNGMFWTVEHLFLLLT